MNITIDIETECAAKDCEGGSDCFNNKKHGLMPHKNRVTCIGVTTDQKDTWVYRGDKCVQQLGDYLRALCSMGIVPRLIFQEGRFDIKTLHFHGLTGEDLIGWWAHDTKLMGYVHINKVSNSWLANYQEQRKIKNKALPKGYSHRKVGQHSLKTMAPYFLKVAPFWEDPSDHDNDEYVMKDVTYTYKLFEYFKDKMSDREWEFYTESQLPWAKELLRAELTGVRLDIDRLAHKELEANTKLELAYRALVDKLGSANRFWRTQKLMELEKKYFNMFIIAKGKAKDPGEAEARLHIRYNDLCSKAKDKLIGSGDVTLNLDSPKQLSWLLRDHLGLNIENYEGKESTDKEVLERLSGESDIVRSLLDYRKYSKLCSTYYPSYHEFNNNGRIHCGFNTAITRTGRISSSMPNLQNQPPETKELFIADEGCAFLIRDLCLHPKTELLTKRGWVKILDVEKSDEVWQVNKDSLVGSWTNPSRIIKKHWKGKLLTYGNIRGKLTVTPGHTMLFVGQYHKTRKDKERLRFVEEAAPKINGTNKNLLLASSSNEAPTNFIDDDIWKCCAIAADGHKSRTGRYEIQVSKLRKREKLTQLFGGGRVANFIRPCHNLITETWGVYYEHPLLNQNKTLNMNRLGPNQCEAFLEALAFWDGSSARSGSITWGTTQKQQADDIQGYLVRCGYEAKIRQHLINKNSVNEKCFYSMHIRKRPRVRLRTQDVQEKYYTGPVGCVTVPEGFILVRSEGQTFVTGNCAIEPHVIAYYSRDKELLDVVLNNQDFHGKTAKIIFPYIDCDVNEVKAKYPKERAVAKTGGLAILYGSGATRLRIILIKQGFKDYTKKECGVIVKRIRKFYSGVWDFKEDLDTRLEGGEVVYNYMGRPLYYADDQVDDIYMKGFNSLIQGTASDMLCSALKKYNDDAIPQGGQVLISVHDELLAQVPKDSAPLHEAILIKHMTDFDLTVPEGRIILRTEGTISEKWVK